MRCMCHPFAGNNRKITETQDIVQQTRSVRPRTGTWEKGEGFNILPLKVKGPITSPRRSVLRLVMGPFTQGRQYQLNTDMFRHA